MAEAQVLLDAALLSENYEEAARIRDGLGAGEMEIKAASSPQRLNMDRVLSPFDLPAFTGILESGLKRYGKDSGRISPAYPEEDVVLETRVRVSRNFAGLPFPRATSPLPADFDSLVPHLSKLPGMMALRIGSLPAGAKEALVERAFFPRPYSLDPDNLVIASVDKPVYALIGEGDSLKFIFRSGGLAAHEGLGCLEPVVDAAASWHDYAFDEEFGFLASKLNDCGTGLFIEALVHLPALASLGMAERALRTVLARGLAVRGIYGEGAEAPSGVLYSVATDRAFGQSAPGLARDFESALSALAQAERRARAELAAKRRDDILDRAGRAFGLIRYCRFLGEAEARAALSSLRLASLSGCLEGVSPDGLGRLMLAQGPGMTLFSASELSGVFGGARAKDLRGARKEERLRALSLAESLESGRIKEGGC